MPVNVDEIYIYETKLQERIAQEIHKTYGHGSFLIIDATSGRGFRLHDKEIPINLNGMRACIKSLPPPTHQLDIRCKRLYCTGITGYNALLFPSFIKFDSLSLFDDGIGTPLLLRDLSLFSTRKARLKHFIAALTGKLLGIKLLHFRDVISIAAAHYTIYHKLPAVIKSTITIPLYNNTKIRVKESDCCFIGQNLIEQGYLTKSEILTLLSKLVKKYGCITYLMHPRESWCSSVSVSGINFLRPSNGSLDHFIKNKMPQHVYAINSSLLLDLAHCEICGSHRLYACDIVDKNVHFEGYYKLFKGAGITVLSKDDIKDML